MNNITKCFLIAFILFTQSCAMAVKPVAIKKGCIDILGILDICPNIQTEEVKDEEIQTEEIEIKKAI